MCTRLTFMAVTCDHHGLFLYQKQYIADIIDRADMTNCISCPTPIDTKPKLNASPGTPFENPTQYRNLVGALQYITFTRLDISYAVQQVCLHMHDPHTEHMSDLKRIIRYLQGTMSHGLFFNKSSVDKLISYTDADWEAVQILEGPLQGIVSFLGTI
ncbi:unnamed protein product [Cuscuta epithymum]|uniref:Reverse transcriptase Ty1/copia-type domain-containing protein n=1 Tax=Cuscuta epithymum TaxID=186058 RepID=A0AAV0C824_9ASTE|nr:unnamed protein product [Cuscuta epithymum]